MDGDQAKAVWARIDAALERIERAASRPPQGDSQLAARHANLREEVGEALRQLDGLIAGRAA